MTFLALREENEALKTQNAVLSANVETLSAERDVLTQELERQRLIVKKLQHRLFGKSSER